MESIGFLEVAVRTAGGALPVRNALVSIYGNEEGKENGLIYSLVTNEAGTTPRVALAAPPVILSQSPENENTYGAYNVYVTKEGFYNSEHIGDKTLEDIAEDLSSLDLSAYPEREELYNLVKQLIARQK